MRIIFFLIPVLLCRPAISQITTYNFRRLTTNEGLSDGIVHSFTQDKYGYIWIGTSYGLNRFDGINVKSYLSKARDSSTLMDNYVQSLYCDGKNNLWVGTMTGLCRFDYPTGKFVRYHSPSSIQVNDISEDEKGIIWLATTSGLWIVEKGKTAITRFTLNGNPDFEKKFQCPVLQIAGARNGNWYFATTRGVKIFNPLTGYYDEIRYDSSGSSISSDYVYSVSLDTLGNLWAVCTSAESILNKINLKDHSVKQYDRFIKAEKKWATNTLGKVLTDKKGRIWVTSVYTGLSLYDANKDDFTDFRNDPFIPNSILANQNIAIYQDREGIIWLGTGGYGLSYFNPDKNLFSTIHPLQEQGNSIDTWCRTACEDKYGNLWLGTGKGVIVYNNKWRPVKVFTNDEEKKPQLYYNSVRSLLEDNKGDIWIGTARGLNRYHPLTGVMDFFDEKQNIPRAFFWMMQNDMHGGVWLGSASGLFRYIREKDRFDDLSKDSLFSKYAHHNVQALYVDSRNRLWIGLLDVGLVMYDPDHKKLKLLTIKDSLISDTRFSSFAEDHDGIIWIGSELGLTAYDPAKNISVFYTRESGLPSDRTNNVMVDSFNRVWVGTSNGLCLLSRNRDRIKRFDVNDGMLTNQYNEQSACRMREGLFVYPTYKGYVLFRPEDYHENTSTIPVYITSFKISEKEIITNTESVQKIALTHNQNFFSIALAGLNYMNATSCLYGYKLEPFDKDWIFTRKRELNYTNVPAGKYVFRYKVITDNPNWSVPEKTLGLTINEIFYRTWWFKSLILLIMVAGIFSFYRYRVYQHERIGWLQNKAQLLEKEKTVVQYESLKQQLNPHFLFNSLTSLRGLIKKDQGTAIHFLDGMSKIYRYVLKSGDEQLVQLKDELNFVQTFTELQKTRFKQGLQVNINVDEENNYKFIAPVTLQNLVENAIKHNTADPENPLVIDIFTENGCIVVRNNLQRYRIVETSNKKGLVGLKSLYRYYSDTPLQIDEDEKFFTVKIPLL